MNRYEAVKNSLVKTPGRWLITGVAGFIGSNILETLLSLDQTVTGLDNFSTGYKHNLQEVKSTVTDKQWKRFTMVEGDIRDMESCRKACAEVDYALHQAALGSVPRSITDPVLTNENNISGFLNMLTAAREANLKSFVYAASSSTYGDSQALPKQEDKTGSPLSPYAVTKLVNELYADVFFKSYGFRATGLRYFNVFGKRQDPQGAYAAVIPLWFKGLICDTDVFINGDGETSRDFCYIDNCVQANILAACTGLEEAKNQVYNVACGERTSLNELFALIREYITLHTGKTDFKTPIYRDFRKGDVRHSLADITRAGNLLGYSPDHSVKDGLSRAAKWYIEKFSNPAVS